MSCLRSLKPTQDNAVYMFIQKKIAEGKLNKVAKIAGLNKFLRIYYARVNEVYSENATLNTKEKSLPTNGQANISLGNLSIA